MARVVVDPITRIEGHRVAVDGQPVLLVDHGVARQADNPLDVVDSGIRRQTEDHDIAAFRGTGLEDLRFGHGQAQAVRVFLYEDEVAFEQRRHHRARRNPERFEHEGPDHEHEQEHREERTRIVDDRVPCRRLARRLPGLLPQETIHQQHDARDERQHCQDQCEVNAQVLTCPSTFLP